MKLVFVLVVLVAAVCGQPGPSEDLSILQRYLEEAVQEMDLRHVHNHKRQVQSVLDFMDTMQPGQVSELQKPIKDMDTSIAASQTVAVIDAYFRDIGVTDVTCIETLASMGLMKVVVVKALTPLRIRIFTAVFRVLVLAVTEHKEFSQLSAKIHDPFETIEEHLEDASEDIVEDAGLPEGIEIEDLMDAIKDILDEDFLTDDGKTIVAKIVHALATAVDPVKAELNARTCDSAPVKTKLMQLKTDIRTTMTEVTSIQEIEDDFDVTGTTATKIQQTYTTIMTAEATHKIVTDIADAATVTDIAEILFKELFAVTQAMITEKEEVTRLETAAGSEMPDMTTPAREVPLIEIIRTAIAIKSHLVATFGYNCEVPKLISVVAGVIENKRFDYSLVNPVTMVSKRIIMGMVKNMDPAPDMSEASEKVTTALATFFDNLYKDAVLPLATKLDTDFNAGVVFKTRNLAMVLRTIFWVRTPKTLEDILKMVVAYTLDAFDEVKDCPSEQNIDMVNLAEFLEQGLIDIETIASTSAVTTAQNVVQTLGLSANTGDQLKELLLDTVKVIMPGLNSDLLEMQSALEVDATLDTLRAVVGAQIGGKVYEEMWAAKLYKSLQELEEEDDD